MNTSAKILGGFLAGAAIGAIAGILLAPDSGANTRQRVLDESKRLTDQLADSISKGFNSVKGEAKRQYESNKSKVQETLDA